MLTVTVVVPTYRRPQDLARCLQALHQQIRQIDEVIVTVRDTDSATWKFLEAFDPQALPLRTITVGVPGVIAAMNLGFAQAKGDIIALTDDDAAPRPDWVARLEAHFLANDRVGGVGGRDWVHQGGQTLDDSRPVVGKLQWFGRVIGNHHLGVGDARSVDVLKGVNMAWRRTAISGLRFDDRLRGTGAQAHFEIAFSLAVRRAGWTLIYDPLVAVDHYPAQRFDEDQRQQFNAIALENAVHNETLALLEHLSIQQRAAFLLWAVGVGTRASPGLLQWLRFLPKEGRLAQQKWSASLQGRWQGLQTWRSSHQHDSKNAVI
jgi:cellulose synthase/poly-beta-1,6-N-acetylglucosamine synthase-like glycosyltransferase